MRRVTYKSVQDGVAGLLGWEPENLSREDQVLVNARINTRARYAWDAFPWPEWTTSEKRLFRPVYASGSTYAAGAEVFFYATRSYYVALRAVSAGHAPATLSGGVWSTNLAYWAESKGSYTADDYDSTRTYVRGEQVYDPGTDAFYQLFAATATATAPTDAASWGVLVELERTIDYAQVLAGETAATVLGRVAAVWDQNPRTKPDTACKVAHRLQDNGLRVLGTVNIVWVEFSLRAPSWTGTVWSATASYTTGQQMYFTDGDYYQALTAVAAGESPATNAAKWLRLDFPDVISRYVIEGASADVRAKAEGEPEGFPNETEECFAILQAEFDTIERGQGQTTQLEVKL